MISSQAQRTNKCCEQHDTNYEKLVYQSQSSDNNLVELAEAHAEKLNLNFEHRHTGFGDLEKFVKNLGGMFAFFRVP